jgi:hypothetical protein
MNIENRIPRKYQTKTSEADVTEVTLEPRVVIKVITMKKKACMYNAIYIQEDY